MTNIELHKEISRLLTLSQATPSDKDSMQHILNTIHKNSRTFCKSCSGDVRAAFNSIKGYFRTYKDNMLEFPNDKVTAI